MVTRSSLIGGVLHQIGFPSGPEPESDWATFERLVSQTSKNTLVSAILVGAPLEGGETSSRTESDNNRLYRLTVSNAAGKPVICTVANFGTRAATIAATTAAQAGAASLSIAPPLYWPATEDAVFTHIMTTAAAAALPFLVISDPRITGQPLPIGALNRLVRSDGFLGVVDYGTSFAWAAAAHRALAGSVSPAVYLSASHYPLATISLGPSGIVVGGDEAEIAAMAALLEHVRIGGFERARVIQFRVAAGIADAAATDLTARSNIEKATT